MYIYLALALIALHSKMHYAQGYRDAVIDQTAQSKKHCQFVHCIEDPGHSFLFDWESVIKPCKQNMTWLDESQRQKMAEMRTCARKTSIITKDIKGVHLYSSVVIRTYTARGEKKRIGGDSWRATVRSETTSQVAFVRDINDGTYEIKFWIYEEGKYDLELVLEHSMCDGLRDPPMGWFESGDMQGHNQPQNVLGKNNDLLVERIKLLSFEIKASSKSEGIKGAGIESCGEANVHNCNCCPSMKNSMCRLVWDSFGYWKNVAGELKWLPKNMKRSSRSLIEKYNYLWLYGDSICQRWWFASSRKRMCRSLFKACQHTYTFTYADRKYDTSKVNVGVKFNKTRFFAPINEVLNNRQMKNHSILVINFGLHLIFSLNFTELKDLIDTLADKITSLNRGKDNMKMPHIIWKTTTFSRLEEGRLFHASHARFLTNQRIRLYNAYTNWKLCSVGVDIFDVFIVTASYPKRSLDGLHYTGEVFRPAEESLGRFLAEGVF